MARSKKKTTRDRLFEAAISAAPAPVRTIASNPIGFRLLMIAAAALMATGILTLDWQDGVPRFNFHRDKAREVRQELVQDLGQQVQKWEQGQGITVPESWKGSLQSANPPGHLIQTPNPYQQQPTAGYPPATQGAWGQQPLSPTNGYYQPNAQQPGQYFPGQYQTGQYQPGQKQPGQVPPGQYPQQPYPYPNTGNGYPPDYRR